MTARELYELMVREFSQLGTLDPWQLAIIDRAYWVMDLDHYKQVRAAARANGLYGGDDDGDPDKWIPAPEDRIFGLRIEVRDDGGAPHVETPNPQPVLDTSAAPVQRSDRSRTTAPRRR